MCRTPPPPFLLAVLKAIENMRSLQLQHEDLCARERQLEAAGKESELKGLRAELDRMRMARSKALELLRDAG